MLFHHLPKYLINITFNLRFGQFTVHNPLFLLAIILAAFAILISSSPSFQSPSPLLLCPLPLSLFFLIHTIKHSFVGHTILQPPPA